MPRLPIGGCIVNILQAYLAEECAPCVVWVSVTDAGRTHVRFIARSPFGPVRHEQAYAAFG